MLLVVFLLLQLFCVGEVDGQLSPDEIFSFYSKYAYTGQCKGFDYSFRGIRINPFAYNQLRFDCDSSSVILRNRGEDHSSSCENTTESSRVFRIAFYRSSSVLIDRQTTIEVNQILLRGIELASLDDFVHRTYTEFGYYRSQWALLINLKNSIGGKVHHLVFASNGDMTFVIFLFHPESDSISVENNVDLIFPNENTFSFNRSATNVWRIDGGFARSPKSAETPVPFQISKNKFTLFANETFYVYGVQGLIPRRLSVRVNQINASCTFDYILRCIFPILSLDVDDNQRPLLVVYYSRIAIGNVTISLVPRTRLTHIPTNHSIFNISALKVNLPSNLCENVTLKSQHQFIIHLRKDVNGTAQYISIVEDELPPVDCNATVPIGVEIEKRIQPITIKEIISMTVDLIHQWYGEVHCPQERTRISFW